MATITGYRFHTRLQLDVLTTWALISLKSSSTAPRDRSLQFGAETLFDRGRKVLKSICQTLIYLPAVTCFVFKERLQPRNSLRKNRFPHILGPRPQGLVLLQKANAGIPAQDGIIIA